MPVKFRARLESLEAGEGEPAAAVEAVTVALQEGYNTGWSGMAILEARLDSRLALTPGSMLSAVMASGVIAGGPITLQLYVNSGVADGEIVRTWPCVVNRLVPFTIDDSDSRAGCIVDLVDPVSFLADQPVWGAYRAVSAGEIVGGALSLAAGGDGKPSLTPVLPNLPSVRIVEDYRDALKRLPYAIAAGRTLGDWLADFLAMLGLRAELNSSGPDGTLMIRLSDSAPRGMHLDMSVLSGHPGELEPHGMPPLGRHGPIIIRGHSGFPGSRLRGGLLDDPSTGAARPLVALGPVGTVLTAPGLDIEEASGRIFRAVQGTLAEMLMVSASSRQPLIDPGKLVSLSKPVHGHEVWQVTSVWHVLRGGGYDNDATLIRGDVAWHPELPLYRPPVFVTAVVNGGSGYAAHQPVPRDRLGRIKIIFPFTPTPVGQEADEHIAADSNFDGRITMDDFTEGQIRTFTSDSAQWEEETVKYAAGDYDDPFPGSADSDLSGEEKQQRDEYARLRKDALAYMAFQRARSIEEQDADRDGFISARDELVSDELSEVLKDEAEREKVRQQWEGWQAWMAMSEDERADASEPDFALDVERLNTVLEYGELFGEDESEEPDEEVAAARKDAEDASDRWPPRISLPVIEPMAGALHGFITAHRHGDICRVAVHDPFSAEIVGFQYRDDRKINVGLSDSVAGIVVEHNFLDAWSGLVFRQAADMGDVSEPSSEEDD